MTRFRVRKVRIRSNFLPIRVRRIFSPDRRERASHRNSAIFPRNDHRLQTKIHRERSFKRISTEQLEHQFLWRARLKYMEGIRCSLDRIKITPRISFLCLLRRDRNAKG